MYTREETTTGKKAQIEPREGGMHYCAFSHSSPHFQNLIEASDTRVYASIKPRTSLQHLLQDGCIPPGRSDEPASIPSGQLGSAPTFPAADTQGAFVKPDHSVSTPDSRITSRAGPPIVSDSSGQCLDSVLIAPAIHGDHGNRSKDDKEATTSVVGGTSGENFDGDAVSVIETLPSTSEPTNSPVAAGGEPLLSSCTDLVQQAEKQRQTLNEIGRVDGDDQLWVGSKDLIHKIKDALHLGKRHVDSEQIALRKFPRAVLLHGMGGSGKSLTARKFVATSNANLDLVIWLHCANPASLGASFHRAAIKLGLVDRFESQNHAASRTLLMDHLTRSSQDWLLIFDDIDNTDPELVRSICHVGGRHLFTSRRHDIAQRLPAGCLTSIRLGPFSLAQSIRLLRKLAPNASAEDDDRPLRAIAAACSFQPSALAVIGKIVNRTGCSYLDVCIRLCTYSGTLSAGLPYSVIAPGSTMSSGTQLSITTHANSKTRTQRSSSQEGLTPAYKAGYQESAHHVLARIVRMLSGAWKLPKGDLAIHLTSSFLCSDHIDQRILQSSMKCREGIHLVFPDPEPEFLPALKRLWSLGLLDPGMKGHWTRPQILQEASLQSMDNQEFVDAFRTVSTLLLSQWPKPRKLGNVVRGYWPEFDSLHSNVWNLTILFADCEGATTSFRASRKPSLKRRIPASRLVTDAFLKLIIYCSW
jgi:hypothetical protein